MKLFLALPALLAVANAKHGYGEGPRLNYTEPRVYQDYDHSCATWRVDIEYKVAAWPICVQRHRAKNHGPQYILHGGTIGKGKCKHWYAAPFGPEAHDIKAWCLRGSGGDDNDGANEPFKRQENQEISIEEGETMGRPVIDVPSPVKRDILGALKSLLPSRPAPTQDSNTASSKYSAKIASMLRVAGRQKQINRRDESPQMYSESTTSSPPKPHRTPYLPKSYTTSSPSRHYTTSAPSRPYTTSSPAKSFTTSYPDHPSIPSPTAGPWTNTTVPNLDIGTYSPRQLLNIIAPLRKSVEQIEAQLRYTKGQLRALDPSNPLAAEDEAYTSSPFAEVKSNGETRTNTTNIIDLQNSLGAPPRRGNQKRQFPPGPAPDRPNTNGTSIEELSARIIDLQSQLDSAHAFLMKLRAVQMSQRENPGATEEALGYGKGDTMTDQRPHQPPEEEQAAQGNTAIPAVPRESADQDASTAAKVVVLEKRDQPCPGHGVEFCWNPKVACRCFYWLKSHDPFDLWPSK